MKLHVNMTQGQLNSLLDKKVIYTGNVWKSLKNKPLIVTSVYYSWKGLACLRLNSTSIGYLCDGFELVNTRIHSTGGNI